LRPAKKVGFLRRSQNAIFLWPAENSDFMRRSQNPNFFLPALITMLLGPWPVSGIGLLWMLVLL
jgi:hypothetical protein